MGSEMDTEELPNSRYTSRSMSWIFDCHDPTKAVSVSIFPFELTKQRDSAKGYESFDIYDF